MHEFLVGAMEQLVARLSGLFHFRFVMQPLVAIVIAVRAGLRDAAAHQPAYLWAIVSDASSRRLRLASGWKDIGRVAIIALMLDSAFQLVVFRWIYPLQAIIIACTLAIIPYLIIRGPTARIARRLREVRCHFPVSWSRPRQKEVARDRARGRGV
jgi:hypothetical protein